MQPNIRRAVIAAILVVSLAPGLAQARTFHGSPRALTVDVGRAGGFFSTVWSLLTDLVAGRVPGSSFGGSPLIAKDTADNGGHLDPNGVPLTTTTDATPPPDNGGHLDPNG
jgi:hypothetical protein